MDKEMELVGGIKNYYRERASTQKYATSPDFNLREVEIEAMAKWLRDDVSILDVGCGNGYSTLSHAARFKSSFVGVDFVPEMISSAALLQEKFALAGSVKFQVGDATELNFPDASFDIVTSQRCLLNLPSRESQWKAIGER